MIEFSGEVSSFLYSASICITKTGRENDDKNNRVLIKMYQ